MLLFCPVVGTGSDDTFTDEVNNGTNLTFDGGTGGDDTYIINPGSTVTVIEIAATQRLTVASRAPE